MNPADSGKLAARHILVEIAKGIGRLHPIAWFRAWAATVTTPLELLPGTTPCAGRRHGPSR